MVAGSTGQKASGEGVIQGDTNSWNVADGFTKINILKILIEINLYETLAKFGKQNVEDEVLGSEIPYRRIDGIDRLMFCLKQVMNNCSFQIKDKGDKDKIKNLQERVDMVETYADGLTKFEVNDVTKETNLVINEVHFRKSLDILSKVKEELHFVLNNAGLIFRKVEETNLEDFMESVYNG